MLTTRKIFLKGAGVALGIFLLLSLAVDIQAATIYVDSVREWKWKRQQLGQCHGL